MKRTFETINLLKSKYENTSSFYFSIFLHKDVIVFSDFLKGIEILKSTLFSDEFMESYPDFYPINLEVLSNAMKLNRFELEGSLIDMLIKGTCTDKIVSTEEEARMLVTNLFKELKLDNNSTISFKLDNCPWAEEIKGATVSCFYIIYQVPFREWMIIGFADFY